MALASNNVLRMGIVRMETRACLRAPENMESIISRNKSKLLRSVSPNFVISRKC